MNVRTALLEGTGLLEREAIPAARLTAEVLLCHALSCERARLYSHDERELSDLEWLHYGRYLHERLQGKPTQYITGRQEFYGREFRVTPGVLIPRPETEHVVEVALAGSLAGKRILDVGCGSGTIAVTLALEASTEVWAADISIAAIRVAWENALRLGARVQFLACDVMAALAPQCLDLIVSNPPYVPADDRAGLQREVRDFEPAVALFAGPSGLDFYRRLVADAERVLRPGGALIVELSYRSRDAVIELMAERWDEIEVFPDLAGIPRVLKGTMRRDA